MRFAAFFALFLIITLPSAQAAADDALSATLSAGLFFEFGDIDHFSVGFEIWGGARYYPSVDPDSDDNVPFVSAGLQLRTGLLPLLTGPNQISPQLRTGVAFLRGTRDLPEDGSYVHDNYEIDRDENLWVPQALLYAILGYRWAFEFGLDNLDGRRKDENAFRFGVGAAFPGVVDETYNEYGIAFPNAADYFIDINLDGTIDRQGFFAGFGT